MIDLKRFFFDFENLSKNLAKRGVKKEKLVKIRKLLEEEKKISKEINCLREKRNELSKKKEESNKEAIVIRKNISEKEEELEKLKLSSNKLINSLPNIASEDNPNNKEVFHVIREKYFEHKIEHQLSYLEILRKLDIIDEERGVLLAGNKFVVYQGLGSKILHSLINLMRHLNEKKGYKLIDVPYLTKEENLFNTGQFPKFKNQVYKIKKENLFLIPTSEVPLVNLFQNQIINKDKLPIKVCAYSPCFRVEAGSSGNVNSGLKRLHQFHKVELVKITEPDNSAKELETLVLDSQNILNELKISHRVIQLSNKEISFSSAKTYDIELWLPVSKKWLEISSCSNCTDFQTRRAKIKVINAENKKKVLAHSLNGSGLAIDRLIAALAEYYYSKKENKINLPELLQKFFF